MTCEKWTVEEVGALKHMMKEGRFSLSQMAQVLPGRSRQAVRKKRDEIRRSRLRRPRTDQEEMTPQDREAAFARAMAGRRFADDESIPPDVGRVYRPATLVPSASPVSQMEMER